MKRVTSLKTRLALGLTAASLVFVARGWTNEIYQWHTIQGSGPITLEFSISDEARDMGFFSSRLPGSLLDFDCITPQATYDRSSLVLAVGWLDHDGDISQLILTTGLVEDCWVRLTARPNLVSEFSYDFNESGDLEWTSTHRAEGNWLHSPLQPVPDAGATLPLILSSAFLLFGVARISRRAIR